ncbi:MAG: inorganic triphosphatase [Parvularculaceae bacterium]
MGKKRDRRDAAPFAPEIELKLRVAPEALPRLRRSRMLHRMLGGARSRERLIATYFDTPDERLRKMGVSLRLREENGALVQTVKRKRRNGGAALARDEFEAPIADAAEWPKPAPDRKADAAIRKAHKRGELQPQFVIDVRRRAGEIRCEDGARIELAVDQGVIGEIERDAGAPFAEIELELLEGDAGALFEAARPLAAFYPLRPAIDSKAEFARRFVRGALAAPRKAGRLDLGEASNIRGAFAALLNSVSRQFIGNVDAVAEARDPEGVHQMRVALRRLRAAWPVFRRFEEDPQTSVLVAESKSFQTMLGQARDCDVFEQETLAKMRRAAACDDDLNVLSGLLVARRERAWRTVLDEIDRGRAARLATELGAAAARWRARAGDPGLAQGPQLKGFAARALRRAWRRAKGHGPDLIALSPAERHALRIDLKKLRYGVDLFGSLFRPKTVSPYRARLRRLQDDLGAMNDAAVAISFAEELRREAAGGDPARAASLARAAGLVAGWRLREVDGLLPHAQACWKDLRAAPRFWAEK